MQQTEKSLYYYKILILLECLIWGVGNPITCYVYISMTPFSYMAVRFAAAFLIFILIGYRKIVKDLNRENIIGCTIVGTFMGGAYIFGNLALAQTMVTITGFLMGISVIFTSIFAVIFLKQKLKKIFLCVLAIVILGMYLLCSGGSGAFSFGIGEFFAISSAVCLGATLMLSAKYVKEVSPFTVSAFQCLTTAVICLVFALIFEDFSCVLHGAPVSWAAMIYLTLGCTVLAFIFQNVSIQHLSPIFVSLAFCTEPIFTAIASYFMLGERLTLVGFAGCILITLGVIVASVSNSAQGIDRDDNGKRIG